MNFEQKKEKSIETAVVCRKDSVVINIFDSPNHATKCGYGDVEKNLNRGLNSSSIFSWSYLKDNEESELIYEKNNSNIIMADENGNILKIYKGPWEIPKIKLESLSKQLLSPKESKKIYYGGIWYFLSEYKKIYLNNFNAYEYPIDSSEVRLNIVLTVTGKLISVNDLYKTKIIYSGGRPRATIYKNPLAHKLESEIRNQLLSVDFKNYINWLSTNDKFSVTFNYVLKTGVTRRDLDNFSKMSCDCLVSHFRGDLGIKSFDDSQFIELHQFKSINPSASHEYICVQIKKSNHNIRFDILPRPEKITLLSDVELEWVDEIKNNLDVEEIYMPSSDIWNEDYVLYKLNTNNTKILIIKDENEFIEKLPLMLELLNECVNDEHKFNWIGIKKEIESPNINKIMKSLISLTNNCSRFRLKLISNISDLIN